MLLTSEDSFWRLPPLMFAMPSEPSEPSEPRGSSGLEGGAAKVGENAESGQPLSESSPIDDEAAAELVRSILENGIPLTLLADLVSPFGPDSERILTEERAERDAKDDDPDDDGFSPRPVR